MQQSKDSSPSFPQAYGLNLKNFRGTKLIRHNIPALFPAQFAHGMGLSGTASLASGTDLTNGSHIRRLWLFGRQDSAENLSVRTPQAWVAWENLVRSFDTAKSAPLSCVLSNWQTKKEL